MRSDRSAMRTCNADAYAPGISRGEERRTRTHALTENVQHSASNLAFGDAHAHTKSKSGKSA